MSIFIRISLPPAVGGCQRFERSRPAYLDAWKILGVFPFHETSEG